MKGLKVYIYSGKRKNSPFKSWLLNLDLHFRARIHQRIIKIENDGHISDYKKLKGVKNIYELRIHFGKGLRIYFTFILDSKSLLLLLGGDKSSQKKDIFKALNYLKSHQESEEHHE